MRKEIRKHEIQAPIYDPNEEPIMDNIRIRQLLPTATLCSWSIRSLLWVLTASWA